MILFDLIFSEKGIAIKLKYAGKSDVGLWREQNEDNFYISPEHSFCVLADGMGGHQAGEIASRMAVDIISAEFVDGIASLSTDSPKVEPAFVKSALDAVKKANRNIFEKGESNPNYRQMGTTVLFLALYREEVVMAHVGDSRIYLIRQGAIEQLTEDHSFIYEQLKANLITPEEAKNSYFRSMVTRALGVRGDVKVDLGIRKVEEGDLFLLCSDGLSDFSEDDEILQTVLCHRENLTDAAQALVDLSNGKGGKDNITVVLAEAVAE